MTSLFRFLKLCFTFLLHHSLEHFTFDRYAAVLAATLIIAFSSTVFLSYRRIRLLNGRSPSPGLQREKRSSPPSNSHLPESFSFSRKDTRHLQRNLWFIRSAPTHSLLQLTPERQLFVQLRSAPLEG